MAPEGWRTVLLDSVSMRGSGHTPKRDVRDYWNGSIKWVSLADSWRLDQGYIKDTDKTITELGIENSSAVVHPAGTVVMTRDAGVGKSAVLNSPMAVSQHFMAWDCSKSEDLHNWYLYHWLQYEKPEFERIAVGSAIKTIGLPYFKGLRISLPPIEQQRHIARVLATWDSAIATTGKLLANAQHIRQTTSQALLSGRQRLLPFAAWPHVHLAKLITESRIPGTSGKVARKLTVKLYGKGVIANETRRHGSEATAYYRRRAGQFIYSKLDFLNGAFGLVPEHLDGFESTLDLPAFDFVSKDVDPRWFLYYVAREDFYKDHLGLANGGRKARRVNPADFLQISIDFPPLAEQQAIADAMDLASEDVRNWESMLAMLKTEKQALMADLLTGRRRVRVPEESPA